MIKLLKGLKFCERNSRSIYPESCVMSCTFEFRGKIFEINNTLPWDQKPYLGAELTRNHVIGLISWLQKCLEDKKCDYCWNIEMPDGMEITGNIRCSRCGELYK